MSDKRTKASETDRREDPIEIVDDLVGADSWKRSKLGWLTGVGAARDAVSTMRRGAQESLGRVGTIFGRAFSRDDRTPEYVSDIADERERFAEAMAFHRRSETDVATMLVNSYRGFLLYASLAAVCLVAFVSTFIFGSLSTLPVWLEAVFKLVPVPAMLAFAVRWGHLNWVVRRRRLGGLFAYLGSGEIWPARAFQAPVVRKRRDLSAPSIVSMLALAAFSGFALLAGGRPAMAVTPDELFTIPPGTDLFLTMLSYLVPEVGPVPASPYGSLPIHQALAAGFTAFSGTLLLVGSAMMAWHILSGMVHSAYEGKVLGQRWHQIWAPIRVVMGFGFLMPVVGGYCAAQIIVLYLVAWGGTLANIVWTPYVDVLTSAATARTPEQIESVGRMYAGAQSPDATVKQLLMKELCWRGIEAYNSLNSYSGGAHPEYPTTVKYAGSGNNVTAVLDYGPVCGSVKIPLSSASSMPSTLFSWSSTPDVAQVDMDRINAIQNARTTLSSGAGALDLNGIVRSYIDPDAPTGYAFDPETVGTGLDISFLTNAITSYRTDLETIGKTLAGSTEGLEGDFDALKAQATSAGWVSSGLFYMSMGNISASIYQKFGDKPSFSIIGSDESVADIGDHLKNILFGAQDQAANQLPGLLTQANAFLRANSGIISGDVDLSASESDFAGEGNGSIEAYFSAIFYGALDLSEEIFHVDPVNPMKSMADIGHFILNAFWIAYGAYVALSVAAQVAGKNLAGRLSNFATGWSDGLQAVIGHMGFLMTMILLALLAVGIVHAYVIPMVPYIMVLFFVIGMLTLTAEAMVAAPLWAFFHIRMDGQDFVDQVQRPGYMIAFNLLLRPVLMVLALIMSSMIFGAVAWFIAQTFMPAVKGITAGFAFGLIGWIVMMVLLGYIHYQTAIRSFSLILQVPDRVMRWFGQGGENLGEDRDSDQMTGVVVGQVSKRAESLPKLGAVGMAAKAGGMSGAAARTAVSGQGPAPQVSPSTGPSNRRQDP